MFNCRFGGLELKNDHLDISYRNPAGWPALTPSGSIRSFAIDIGDPEVGPTLQLGLMTPVEGEVLDWKHSIDPVHHHGSDQFRIISGGEWILANRAMPKGAFAFQEAGWVYQEHPGGDGAAWTALVMADRRGTGATLRFAKDSDTIFEAGSEFGQPIGEEVVYPHPAGNKGLAAISTTAGECRHGYLYLDGDGLDAGPVTGLLGDPEAGPVTHVFKGQARERVVPAIRCATEIVLIVAAGACRIGDDDYSAGDMRVQAADAPFEVIAGSEGVELAMVVGDRRAAIVPEVEDDRAGWMDEAKHLKVGLAPVSGGTWRKAPRNESVAA